MGSRQDLDELRLPARVLERKTAQAFPARPDSRIVGGLTTGSESSEKNMYTHPLHGIPSAKGFDFPLLIVRYVNHKLPERTYETPSLHKGCGWPATHVPRVVMDVHVGLGVEVLDSIDPWLQFSVLEDGRGIVSGSFGHSRASATMSRT